MKPKNKKELALNLLTTQQQFFRFYIFVTIYVFKQIYVYILKMKRVWAGGATSHPLDKTWNDAQACLTLYFLPLSFSPAGSAPWSRTFNPAGRDQTDACGLWIRQQQRPRRHRQRSCTTRWVWSRLPSAGWGVAWATPATAPRPIATSTPATPPPGSTGRRWPASWDRWDRKCLASCDKWDRRQHAPETGRTECISPHEICLQLCHKV